MAAAPQHPALGAAAYISFEDYALPCAHPCALPSSQLQPRRSGREQRDPAGQPSRAQHPADRHVGALSQAWAHQRRHPGQPCPCGFGSRSLVSPRRVSCIRHNRVSKLNKILQVRSSRTRRGGKAEF